jgi:hypothetical protein
MKALEQEFVMTSHALIKELALGVPTFQALLEGVSQAEARLRPEPGSWSPLEVVCHLYDEERQDFRLRLDIVLHRPAEKWPPIDPPGWVTARAYNERDLAQSLRAFLSERQKSLEWLEGLSSPDWGAVYSAPFGPISAGDLLASWVAHDNLHTRQLVELRRARIERLAGAFDPRYAGDW